MIRTARAEFFAGSRGGAVTAWGEALSAGGPSGSTMVARGGAVTTRLDALGDGLSLAAPALGTKERRGTSSTGTRSALRRARRRRRLSARSSLSAESSAIRSSGRQCLPYSRLRSFLEEEVIRPARLEEVDHRRAQMK
jgi:hypothetical protein